MKEKADKIKIMEQIENDRRVRQQELEDKKRQYAQPANHSSVSCLILSNHPVSN